MTQLRLNPKWTTTLSKEEAKVLEKRLSSCKDLFLMLDNLLVQKLEANSRDRRSKKNYDKPAFSEFQADCNAYERGLEEIRTLINFTKEK